MNRTRKNLTRITVAGSGAALLAGMAIPAYACTPPASADLKAVSTSAHPVTLTVAGMKAKVDAFVAKRLAELSAEAGKVTASTRLTDAQKSSIQSRISTEVDALQALKATVDAETTVTAIKADLAAAWLAALKTHVDARIDARIAWLTAKMAKVQASTTISDPKKAAMLASLQAKVDALTSLKATVDAETSAKAVLTDLRAAGDLWTWHDRHGRHGHKGDPGKAKAAVWTRNGHRVGDPKDVRFSMSGRGHACSHAGHHGFGHQHRGGAVRSA